MLILAISRPIGNRVIVIGLMNLFLYVFGVFLLSFLHLFIFCVFWITKAIDIFPAESWKTQNSQARLKASQRHRCRAIVGISVDISLTEFSRSIHTCKPFVMKFHTQWRINYAVSYHRSRSTFTENQGFAAIGPSIPFFSFPFSSLGSISSLRRRGPDKRGQGRT